MWSWWKRPIRGIQYADANRDGIDVERAWSRFRQWANRAHSPFDSHLQRGAKPNEIDEFEQTIGEKLPDEIRMSHAIHNGGATCIFALQLWSLQDVLKSWTGWRTSWEQKKDRDDVRALGAIGPGAAPALEAIRKVAEEHPDDFGFSEVEYAIEGITGAKDE